MGRRTEGLQQRILVIINRLKGTQRYVSREELERYVTLRMEERDGTAVNIRTLQRDIIMDTEEEFRIRLRLRITNDFVMELLSRSRSLTVIKPLHLRERVRMIYEEALKRNL